MIEAMEHQKTLEPAERMRIKGIWTHFGYADELEMDEYEIERGMWLGLLETLAGSGYTFDIVHAQNSASFARDGILDRSEEHTSELQSRFDLVCRLLLANKKRKAQRT